MALNKLKDFNVLVVDSDKQLANVFCSMLQRMGFGNVMKTSNGREAITLLKEKPVDFMITEWNTRELDGLELLSRIRRERATNDQTIPAIMLTGRAERTDVVTARDYGINEYVVKPFSAKTVYARMERLIEMPRSFIVAKSYVGPDRRTKNTLLPKGIAERRTIALKAVQKPANMPADDLPKVWLPDYTLKLKLGRETSLSSVITPKVIDDAQHSIEEASVDSGEWLKENLTQLKTLQNRIKIGDLYTLMPIDMSEIALTMSSRSGTFGYGSASKIAYLLYLFCRNNLRIDDPNHQMVMEKHIDALTSTIAMPKQDPSGKQGAEIISQLQKLSDRYAC